MPGPMRDSLSRCETNPYSLYGVRKQGDTKEKVAIATPSIHKDTIEISRDRIKKEALNRLNHTTKYFILQQGFMRVGKYLFLGLTLPPYLLLYGVPKWVLVVALPSLLILTKTLVIKTYKQVQKKVHQIIEPILQKMQFYGRVLIQPIIRLMLEIRNAFQLIRHNVAAIFYRFSNGMKKPGRFLKKGQEKLLGFFQQKSQKFIKNLNRSFDQARQWMSLPASAYATAVNIFKWIKCAPKQLTEKGRELKSQFNQIFKNLSHSLRDNYRRSQKFAEKSIQFLKKYLHQESQFFKDKTCRIRQLLNRQFSPFTRLRMDLQAKFKSIKILFRAQGHRLDGFVEKILNRLWMMSTKPYLAGEKALSKFPKFFRRILEPILRFKTFQGTLQISLKSLYYGVSLLRKIIKSLVGVIQRTSAFFERGYRAFQQTGQLLKDFCLKYWKVGLVKTGLFLRTLLFHTLVALIMLFLLCIIGIRLLGRVTVRIVKI